MTHTFRELVIEGVLVAPFAAYLAAALVIAFLLRPILLLVGFTKLFSNPQIAELSLYTMILCLLMHLF
ncbi:DUF1656 domain-containing protein [Rhizobium calliandrae]|uniref:DUF1656 domain-containing protein n=1 Tax=Rhizobium calliandrae TaxID=1312182 RepID=A0ABT7KFQ2_9HYPH|nr:DUF1656 domain-containing protein [Rhizobium calliandrae]MDL2406850.1 DUF1656 domain-containing protein [Rhizobium calliandrae]